MKPIGIIHPGAMGVSIAASVQSSGRDVFWAREGRSAATRLRADENNLSAVDTLDDLAARCEAIICVCPPHAAVEAAAAVVKTGFRGLYCDGNAIAPQKARLIAQSMKASGMDFVDGGIIGPPAWQPGATRFYLSGPRAGEIAALFAGTLIDAIALGDEIGQASALKMVFAALTKGSTALLSAIYGAAQSLGVLADLEAEWALRDIESVRQRRNQTRGATGKAWRFVGEMQEIAATFEQCGMPPGFFHAAHEVYLRLADFKDAEETPELEAVLMALTKPS